MSGILAVADLRGTDTAETIARMAAGLRHRPWYVVETAARPGESVALGRVGIGVYNRAPQPARIDDGAIEVVLAGRLFDTAALQRELLPAAPATDDDAILVARLYAEHGADLGRHLRGEFVAAIHDRRLQQLIVTNDRFGFYPTYLSQDQGRLLVGPEMKAITAAPGFTKRLDLTAFAQYMRFQVPLGERTFFEGISLLPPAAVCRCDLRTGTVSCSRYWEFGGFDLVPAVTLGEMAEECGRLLARAVSGGVGTRRAGLFLSGGLDSRLLLGVVEPSARPLDTFTFGRRGCRDVDYARRIAHRAGSIHRWFPLSDGEWVLDNLELDLALTEGSHGWIHMHGVSTLPSVREQIDVALTGWDGGTVVGGWRNRLPLAFTDADDLDILAAREFTRFNQLYTWPGIDEAEERVLYSDAIGRQLSGRAFESLRAEMAPFMSLRPDLRAEMFYIRNHCFRLTLHTLTLLRSHVDVVSPFFDFDLFRFLYSLPATARGYKALLREVLERRAPRLALVPDARDDLMPTTRSTLRQAHWLLSRFGAQVNRRLLPLFAEHSTLYADYEGYLRSDLRSWGEEIVLGSRLRERGLFNPLFLRTLWERIQSGEPDIIGKLAPIMTYELMLRRYWD